MDIQKRLKIVFRVNLQNNLFLSYYSKRGLWTLFLVSAFAPHVWTILMFVRDFEWVSDRTDIWDAVGVGAYGLLIAFIESLFVFLIAVLLGFLVLRRWGESKRIALLSVLLLVVALWEIFAQLYFIWGMSVPETVIKVFASTAHPLRYLYAVALVLVAPTILIPAYLILSSEKTVQIIKDIIDRIALLTTFYLVFDFVALFIVVFRNL